MKMGNTHFFADIGALIYWILIKFCQSKLYDEMSEKYKNRNLITNGLFNLLILILIIMLFLYYN